MRFLLMGAVISTVVVSVILVVVTRSASYMRGRLRVVDAEDGGGSAAVPAAVGVSSGVLVLLLLLLLYPGLTRWDWLGHLSPSNAHISSPAAIASPANPGAGTVSSPSSGPSARATP